MYDSCIHFYMVYRGHCRQFLRTGSEILHISRASICLYRKKSCQNTSIYFLQYYCSTNKSMWYYSDGTIDTEAWSLYGHNALNNVLRCVTFSTNKSMVISKGAQRSCTYWGAQSSPPKSFALVLSFRGYGYKTLITLHRKVLLCLFCHLVCCF